MEAQADHVITDLKNQLTRLSEERAIYFALATQRELDNQQLTAENEQLKSGKVEDDAE
ncbi:hypothetical protein [Sporosarcina psychrophila]|uniref:hypothetical protein n=1 Tax=Sporosarcina psychrophila TaxID=1476 RepID=UPI000AE0E62B|nr:hypothetical protein [Sporosarcina psychrophila]